MFSKALHLLLAAFVLPSAAWHAFTLDARNLRSLPAFGAGLRSRLVEQRARTAVCSIGMIATGSGTDGPGGTVGSYMKKIPPHLQGLAIRNQKKEVMDYGTKTASRSDKDDLAAIQAELDADDDEDELDHLDYAMQAMDDMGDGDASRMKTYDLDIEDAEVLRSLRDKMNNDDFKRVFGRGVGELL